MTDDEYQPRNREKAKQATVGSGVMDAIGNWCVMV